MTELINTTALGTILPGSPADQAAQEKSVTVEKEFHLFMSAQKSMRMCTPKGTPIVFSEYQHITDNQSVIKYLQKEIANGNRAIHTDPERVTVTSDELDPMKALRNKHFREFEKERIATEAAAAALVPDMGGTAIPPKQTVGGGGSNSGMMGSSGAGNAANAVLSNSGK